MTPPETSGTTAKATTRFGPNGAGPAASPVAEMVAELRKLAETGPGRAQRETWAWFKELGAAKANDDLAELFGLGTAPPANLEGPTEGILVNPIIQPQFDAFARFVTAGWMPWMGKSFYPDRQRGSNRITDSGKLVSKLLWPTYQMTPSAEGNMAFDFDTRIEPGAIEPSPDVLVIDYADEPRNPELIIRKIRDELVEIVPHTYLGRILYRLKDGGYNNIGYFALLQRPS
jgi:hypothetical protein